MSEISFDILIRGIVGPDLGIFLGIMVWADELCFLSKFTDSYSYIRKNTEKIQTVSAVW
jgi:hypothetical protein